MKTNRLPTAAILFGFAVLAPMTGAAFDSGSDGSYGPINVTSSVTLNMPPDGIFKCTTINVANGATLRFNANPLNTPVHLLATGNVVIAGTIDVSGGTYSGWMPGKGGPGGFDGGYGGLGIDMNYLGGDGQGPGAGRNSTPYGGVFAAPVGDNRIYGNSLLVPLIGGSGGCGSSCGEGANGYGGGGGGGAILIAANTSIGVTGSINANGGIGYYGGGSGGAIRLVSPYVTGSGALSAAGGGSALYSGYGGGAGRIRLDCTNQYSFRSLTMNGVSTRGAQMFVFPPFTNRLDIIEVAGRAIPEGTNAVIQIELPIGAPTNQTVTVQARGFTNSVAITVAITPENRPSARYDAVIMMTNNPSRLTLDVIIPDGTVSRIHAWTR